MARTIRLFYADQPNGVSRINFNWEPINKKSAVLITAKEFKPEEALGAGSLENIRPHLGDASIWVSNVGVHGPEGSFGGVEFLLHIDWPAPLSVIVDITVLDDIEQYYPVSYRPNNG